MSTQIAAHGIPLVAPPTPGDAMDELSRLSAAELIDLLPYPSFILTADQQVVFVNQAVCRHFGVNREAVIGRTRLDLLPSAERIERERDLQSWFSGDLYPIRFELRLPGSSESFVVLPSQLTLGGSSSLTVVLLPTALLDSARGGPALEVGRGDRAGLAARAAGSELDRAFLTAHGSAELARASDPGLLRLTPREWEIAYRISLGDRVGALAEDLGISKNTVRNHLKSIFRKLQIRSQTQLVRRIRRAGEIAVS